MMEKKEWKTVIVLALVTALLACALALVSAGEKKQAAPEYLLPVSTEKIEKLDFANGSDYVHLVKTGGTWQMAGDETFSVDQAAVRTLLGALRQTQVQSRITVESQTALNDYSLLSPQCIIEFAEEGGTPHSVRVGVMNSMTESLYISLDEDSGTVYVTSNPIAQAFSCTKNDLMLLPEIPTPSEGHKSVTIQNIRGTTEIFREGDKWYVRTEDGPRDVDSETAYNYYFLTWDMHWRGVAEHGTETPEKYDLARPRISYTMTYEENGEEKTFALELGSSLPDGKCYARIKGSNDILLLDSLMADWLESTKTEDLYELQK